MTQTIQVDFEGSARNDRTQKLMDTLIWMSSVEPSEVLAAIQRTPEDRFKSEWGFDRTEIFEYYADYLEAWKRENGFETANEETIVVPFK